MTSDDESDRGRSLSPLTGKSRPVKQETPRIIREVREFVPDPPMLPSDTEEAELTESEDGTVGSEADAASDGVSATTGSEEESDDADYDDEEEADEWGPSAGKTPRAKAKPVPQRAASPIPASHVSKLERVMRNMTLRTVDPDDSVVVVPVKKFREGKESPEHDIGAATQKKKKRCVNST